MTTSFVALVHAAPSLVGGLPADLRGLPAAPAAGTPGITLFMADPPSTSRTSPGTPPCAVEVCQPAVAVPGLEPRWDTRGGRSALFLSMLARMDLGAPSSAARWIAAAGESVDYRMPDRVQTLQFNASMPWRICAFGTPLARTDDGGSVTRQGPLVAERVLGPRAYPRPRPRSRARSRSTSSRMASVTCLSRWWRPPAARRFLRT